MKVSVTKEHIAKGQRRSHCWCPIALALKDAGFKRVFVLSFNFTYSKWFFSAKCKALPETVSDFIRAFDNNEPVKPFEFEIP